MRRGETLNRPDEDTGNENAHMDKNRQLLHKLFLFSRKHAHLLIQALNGTLIQAYKQTDEHTH